MTTVTIPTPVYAQGSAGQLRLMKTPSNQFFWNGIEPNRIFDTEDEAINYLRASEGYDIKCDLPKRTRR